MERSKYSEVANVYSKNSHQNIGRASSNNSRSRDPDNRNKASLNNSALKFNKRKNTNSQIRGDSNLAQN